MNAINGFHEMKRTHPFFYRLLSVCAICVLLSVFSVGAGFWGGFIGWPWLQYFSVFSTATMVVVGMVCFMIAFLLFLYETIKNLIRKHGRLG